MNTSDSAINQLSLLGMIENAEAILKSSKSKSFIV
jgi:hypothetical protein